MRRLHRSAPERTKDLFVLHAERSRKDILFVRNTILPTLSLPACRVELSSELELGEFKVTAVEEAMIGSLVVLVILSPAFLHESWGIYCEAIAHCHAVGGGRLVPVLFKDCELPARLEMRVGLDLRFPEQRKKELARLQALLIKLAA